MHISTCMTARHLFARWVKDSGKCQYDAASWLSCALLCNEWGKDGGSDIAVTFALCRRLKKRPLPVRGGGSRGREARDAGESQNSDASSQEHLVIASPPMFLAQGQNIQAAEVP